ncbi:MAG TPA: vanadium-dependent haloperoxidase [Gammaproteobacteria bacterium]
MSKASTLLLSSSIAFGITVIAPTALVTSSLPGAAYAEAIGPLAPQQRSIEARKLRTEAAQSNFLEPLPAHPDNGDETTYANMINSYTKGLPHDDNGIVDPAAYQSLIHALSTGKPADFDAIIMADENVLGLRNPQAAYTYLMEGKDPHSYTMPAAPAFNSAWQASEAIEVLWQALTRDVPFANYDNDSLIAQAADDLSGMADFRGPKDANSEVSPQTLFRGIGVGESVGPYISQFLLQPIPYGAVTIPQKYRIPVAGNDHLTNYNEWLRIQRGANPSGITTVQSLAEPRYLYNGRALAQYVLQDFIDQAYLGATRIIRGYGANAYDPNDPYKGKTAEARSPLFGNNHAMDFIGRVSMPSQNVAWYQKFLVHRRARPEVFFGHVHNDLTKVDISYPIHADALESPALDIVFDTYGTYLLPQASPAGSPLHPSYPAGHAVMAGAAVTMLKAFFNGDFVIPNPKMPNEDGTALIDYTGPALTIEGELNKLGSNISLGRDVAGVHYRSDGDLGMVLGEEYAITVLRELVKTYNEDFAGFTFNKFDGTPVLVSKEGVFYN